MKDPKPALSPKSWSHTIPLVVMCVEEGSKTWSLPGAPTGLVMRDEHPTKTSCRDGQREGKDVTN